MIDQMKAKLALYLNEQAIKKHGETVVKAIFRGVTGACDCGTCKYAPECERDNPDFDANYCKIN